MLTELANRARITRRPFDTDPALEPARARRAALPLVGSEELGELPAAWTVSEFAALLFQRTTVIARADQRRRAARQAARAGRPRLGPPRRCAGSTPAAAATCGTSRARCSASSPPAYEQPSWYYTERVVQGLVTTANMLSRPPLRSPRLGRLRARPAHRGRALFDLELLTGRRRGRPPDARDAASVARIHLTAGARDRAGAAGHGRHRWPAPGAHRRWTSSRPPGAT